MDDYGWHGISCISIARHLKEFAPNPLPSGKDFDNWLNWGSHAIQCYQRMQKSWDGLQQREPITPPVNGGLSNAPKIPEAGTTYVRNTVTNAIFMLLCMKLYEFLKNEGNELKDSITISVSALNQAIRQFFYFENWMHPSFQSFHSFNGTCDVEVGLP